MTTPEQQTELWRQEKAQMARDKQAQGVEVRRRTVKLSFGGTKPMRFAAPTNDDAFLRKRLGI